MNSISFLNKKAKQILHQHKFIDNWFPFRYSFNPYSGCEYQCLYCRANWRNKKIIVKENLLELLSKEITQLPHNNLIGVGGGYNDIFSPINQKKKLSERAIEIVLEAGHKPFLMTKNPSYALGLVDSWKKFPREKRPILLTSFSTLYQDWQILESNLPSVEERLQALEQLSQDLVVGGALMPIIPNGRNQRNLLKKFINQLKNSHASFSLLGFLDFDSYSYLHKKKVFNKDFDINLFLNQENHLKNYQNQVENDYHDLSQEYGLWSRLPYKDFHGYLSIKDEITVLLAYYYYFQKQLGIEKEAFRHAAFQINQITEKKFSEIIKKNQLHEIIGVGKVITSIIEEIFYQKKIIFMEKSLNKLNYRF